MSFVICHLSFVICHWNNLHPAPPASPAPSASQLHRIYEAVQLFPCLPLHTYFPGS
ncbi:hypothetical protein [Coleofasciculus sp. F4-SAH-05]|uniref:hypothetical protein n=1 Tax=Coleofasciculus sp. F4-SAH-05 TaxID=3069525 RepID=UPI0032F5FCF9